MNKNIVPGKNGPLLHATVYAEQKNVISIESLEKSKKKKSLDWINTIRNYDHYS